jgi:hypothetical protein
MVYPQRTPFGFGGTDWDEPLAAQIQVTVRVANCSISSLCEPDSQGEAISLFNPCQGIQIAGFDEIGWRSRPHRMDGLRAAKRLTVPDRYDVVVSERIFSAVAHGNRFRTKSGKRSHSHHDCRNNAIRNRKSLALRCGSPLFCSDDENSVSCVVWRVLPATERERSGPAPNPPEEKMPNVITFFRSMP